MNRLVIFLIFIFTAMCNAINTQHAVTFYTGGRFGDYLKCCASALWFSQKHNIPFLYPYCPLSDYLTFTGLEQYNPKLHRFDKKIEYTKSLTSLLENSTESILIVMKYKQRPKFSFHNKILRKSLQKLIKPKQSPKNIIVPKGFLPVAIHVRTGGNFVTDHEKKHQQPLRFAPLSYYVNQIKYLKSVYPNKSFYVHLFTDNQNPQDIIQFLQKNIPYSTIQYGYQSNHPDKPQSILEDFFNMMDFEVLIQPKSGFSTMAAYLGNQTLIITPTQCEYIDTDIWHIIEIEITKRYNGKILSKQKISYPRFDLLSKQFTTT